MKALSAVAFAFLAVRSAAAFAPTGAAVLARAPAPSPTVVGYGVTSSSSDDDDDDDSGSTSSNTTSSSTTTQLGDSKCVSTMCVEALVNGGTVQYTLTSQRSSVGYMAMGFGSQMTRTPMVIMWANDDGSITLSQRQASGEVEPDVVSSPPRVASVQQSLSVATGSNPKFVYTIPANSDTQQTIIWAFSSTKPASSATNARLVQHTSQGTMTLNLANVISSGTDGSDSNSGSGSSSGAGALTSRQKMILAHGVIATLGFILFLPIGALIPRYLRTFINGRTWFTTHWVMQFLLAGIAIVIGVALGIAAVAQRGGSPTTTHKRVGLVLFVLYLLQVALGAVIHWVKPRGPRKRPAQNYFHAILGVTIIGLSLWQVRTGYREEWTSITGRDDVPNGINIVWYIWVVLLPVLYAAGMAFLPKQYAQERKARESQGYRD